LTCCAILHELAHVRRSDWLTQAAARAIAACYWFDPLVWIAWRRFALEAERAWDDAVVQRTDSIPGRIRRRRISSAGRRSSPPFRNSSA